VNRRERRKVAKQAQVRPGAVHPAAGRIVQALQQAARFHDAGRMRDAELLYRDVLTIDPNNPDALHLLGMVAYETGHHVEAVKLIRQAIGIRPSPAYYNNLGVVAKGIGQFDEAVGLNYCALALKPDYAEGHNNLGVLFKDRKNGFELAVACFDRAVELKPDYADALANLGNAYTVRGRLDEARSAIERALAIDPKNAGAHVNLGAVYQNQGLMAEAVACYKQALIARPDHAAAHSNLLMSLSYTPVDPDSLFNEFRRWERIHAAPVYHEIQPHPNTRDPERKLRIGYLSADFKTHPIAYNIEGLLAGHDPERFEVYGYAEVQYPDHVTERLKGYAKGWVSTLERSDAWVANRIRKDDIDHLVSLAGQTAYNRPRVLAYKPAPVIASYGDLSTTGMRTVDYWLTDPVIHPEGDGAEGAGPVAERFVERLMRLPHLIIHQPPEGAPDPAPPPHLAAGHIAFGSFNNPAKLTPDVIRLWARVLKAVPGARMVLKFFSVMGNAGFRDRVLGQFADAGVGADRVEFQGQSSERAAHLGELARVDIALDPFPFNGCTTTFEALWMGVPVVTLAGNRFLGRMGASFLTQVGLGDLIAADADSYVAQAAALAADSARLAALRQTLRATVSASKLCDRTGYARAVEAAFREMWRVWCARGDGSAPGPGAGGE
jgi:predicted O-linked N-acetylglucosamine transferase (SPINDLY family)